MARAAIAMLLLLCGCTAQTPGPRARQEPPGPRGEPRFLYVDDDVFACLVPVSYTHLTLPTN